VVTIHQTEERPKIQVPIAGAERSETPAPLTATRHCTAQLLLKASMR
jgi:hypothetical protein